MDNLYLDQSDVARIQIFRGLIWLVHLEITNVESHFESRMNVQGVRTFVLIYHKGNAEYCIIIL